MIPTLPLLPCESPVSMKENPDKKAAIEEYVVSLVIIQEFIKLSSCHAFLLELNLDSPASIVISLCIYP